MMRGKKPLRLRTPAGVIAILGLCLFGWLFPAESLADLVLNADPAAVQAGAVAYHMRYRVSNRNWDQMIGTSNEVTYGTIVQDVNVGNHTDLNNVIWDFSVSYSTGIGYTYTLSRTGQTSTVQWTAPYVYQGNPPVSQLRSFNAIELYAHANASTPPVSSAYISITDLAFTGHGTSGSFVNMNAAWPAGPTGLTQWLVADTDLSLIDWTLSGKVQAGFTGYTSGNIDERIKFDIKTLEATVVPIPGAVWLLGSGLIGLIGIARRRRK
ncbi:MAG: hypothetical protein HXY45_06800 [Syntrophaceae bacterium]|nr:hypothetical protein [Syntrophaceae bacterium]